MTMVNSEWNRHAPVGRHHNSLEQRLLPAAMRYQARELRQPPRSWVSPFELPAERSDANLWSDIRESVAEYCDERAASGDWHISLDLFSSDVLAFNFFFPLRQDTEGVSHAVSVLRGRPTRVESLDLLPPTVTEAIGACEPPPVSNVVISFDDDAGGGLLLLKCTFTEADLGACPSRTGVRPPTGHRGRASEAAGCSVAWCCPYLKHLSGTLQACSPTAARTNCPFADGGHQVMRGLILAHTIVEAWNARTVEFGLIYDNRNAALASLVRQWDSRVHLLSWSYQAILTALAAGAARPMSAWRAFLWARYGLVPAVC